MIRMILDLGQSVVIGDKHFEVVKEFVYLGSLMTPTNDVSLKIRRKIQTANRCFFGLRKHLQSSHLSRQKNFTILYCSKTWVLTKRAEKQLLLFERKILRTICGPKIENGVYRRRYNHELEREFDSPNVLNVTKTNRLRYAGQKNRRHTTKSSFQSVPNPMEGENKEDRNPGTWMG
jgi:hypothetical protein